MVTLPNFIKKAEITAQKVVNDLTKSEPESLSNHNLTDSVTIRGKQPKQAPSGKQTWIKSGAKNEESITNDTFNYPSLKVQLAAGEADPEEQKLGASFIEKINSIDYENDIPFSRINTNFQIVRESDDSLEVSINGVEGKLSQSIFEIDQNVLESGKKGIFKRNITGAPLLS